MTSVLVTGANRGIGYEICKQLADHGYDVIGVCRKKSGKLKALGIRIHENIDVTNGEDLKTLVNDLAGTRIDWLVNNAGLLERTEFANVEDQLEAFRRMFEVNSLAPVRVTRALANHLNDDGKVFIITSRMGSIADNTSGGAYGYRMSKAAVNAAGKSLAEDFRDRRIAVGLLHPGYVRTDMTGNEGFVDASEAAAGLIERMQELDMESTGSFRHANGEELPW